MVGAVQVPRTLYRKVGERIGATVDAISLRAGVVGRGWLPRTASAMAWECQRAPSREAQKASEQWLRLPYSRSAFRSVAHQVAEQYGPKREGVERQLIETLEIGEQAHSVSVSMDRVSIPMEEPSPAQSPASQSAVEDSVSNAPVQQMAAEGAPSAVKKDPSEQDRAAVLRKWPLNLLNDDEAVQQILASLQNSGKEQLRVGDSRPVHEAITYLPGPPAPPCLTEGQRDFVSVDYLLPLA